MQRLRDMASEAPTIRLVNQIIHDAVETRASDIHIEPTGDSVLVRYRIDGALRTVPTDLRAAITSRLAASLVRLLDQSPIFAEASLVGPIAVDPVEGKERFIIQAKLKQHASPKTAVWGSGAAAVPALLREV